ncbi:hypothetical protein NE237_027544 [Protea cynaroides]|uniref:Uncharacterized protein n=1 Tax=Protea cynaroides TaxID=273540 RepID=A0A9Q0GRK0_9MAGN|nr:hypothetical protein NE237_027544 [Protea cynaroides]
MSTLKMKNIPLNSSHVTLWTPLLSLSLSLSLDHPLKSNGFSPPLILFSLYVKEIRMPQRKEYVKGSNTVRGRRIWRREIAGECKRKNRWEYVFDIGVSIFDPHRVLESDQSIKNRTKLHCLIIVSILDQTDL